ncbi:hypothetical protein HYH02_005104 [Chlamydomonas schloesseri]|uniref:PsbP C-terminal domain-containing protein n=1 Tax=Chlamydomonas schloesseri TaxID=2026947 RepID=A0A836B726_9CHLO|nr:hypothetical protein HYH02_005104 [Chlamydomonas schloesseri]|eukprot:KAG2449571.1 hypothetical protein HYH02_005104 [Chlamydomonas schloesseri]
MDRRRILLASGAALALGLSSAGSVRAEGAPGASFTQYADPQDSFTLKVPANWGFGEGELSGNASFSGASGGRRTLAWFPENVNPRDVNVTITITNVSVEFTKLGSFGTPFTFASNLVNSQDRSYMLRGPEWARRNEPVMVAKLLDAGEVSNKYFLEYTLQKVPDEPKRHLYTAVALGYNGTYNRLYSITAQSLEELKPQYEATLVAMVKSLSVPPTKF